MLGAVRSLSLELPGIRHAKQQQQQLARKSVEWRPVDKFRLEKKTRPLFSQPQAHTLKPLKHHARMASYKKGPRLPPSSLQIPHLAPHHNAIPFLSLPSQRLGQETDLLPK